MCFDSIKIFIYIDEVILIIIMADDKLVPKLRFSGFKDNWENTKIGDCLDVKYGKDYKHLNKGKYPVLGTGGIMEYVDEFLYSGESILIGRKGTIDKPKYINDSFWTVDTLFYTEIKKQFPKFLFYCISNINWLKYNEASGVPSLSANNIKNVKINIPELIEQKKIANFLTSIDYKIELLDAKHKYYVEFKRYLMQQIFTQKLRFNFHDNWEIKKLGEITQINTGKKDVKDKKDDGKYLFFVRSEKIERIDSYSFDGEAILIPGDGKIGEVYHYINGKFDYHQRVYKISNFHNDVFGKYIYYYLEKNFLRQAMKNTAKATVDSLRMDTLTKMPIELPSFEEQIKIANSLTFTDEKINLAKNNIDVANKFKKGLLQQMFI